METDNLDILDTAIGLFPVREILDVLFRLLHPRDRKNLVELALRKHAPGVEVADAMKNDPDVGVGVVNVVRGCRGEAEEQAELDDDEHERKHNARQRDGEADAVVKQVAASKQRHGEVLGRLVRELRIRGEKSNSALSLNTVKFC